MNAVEMLRPLSCPNVVFILTTTSLLGVFIHESVKASQRYPFVLPKCCESDGNPPPDEISKASGLGHIGICVDKRSEVVVIPKTLFPAMSTHIEHVEVGLSNSVDELKCYEGQDILDFSIELVHNETLRPFNAGGNKGFAEFIFSGVNLLDTGGNIYSPREYCLNSRTANNTRLGIKTCKRGKCSRERPCIPRCCGGHQSILTSPPTFHNESLSDFCSTPTLDKIPWNPWVSNILRVDNRTDFYQMRFTPGIHGDEGKSNPEEQCTLFRVKLEDELSLYLLEDGRLQLRQENKTEVLENFCIDGIKGEAGRILPGDKRNSPEEEEVVVVYTCSRIWWEKTSTSVKKIVRLPSCSGHVHSPNQLIQLPRNLFPNMTTGTKDALVVRLQSGKSDGDEECLGGFQELNVSLEGSTQIYFDDDRWLVLRGVRYHPGEFCIRSESHNVLGTISVCRKVLSPSKLKLAHVLPIFFHVVIFVVYILRKDKEPVFRWSIVGFSFSMTLTQCLYLSLDLISFSNSVGVSIETLRNFFYAYGLSWMSVLSFDVWLTITFLRPRRKSGKRLWGYNAFTFILPIVLLGVSNFAEAKIVFGLLYGLICINFLLFTATAVKLWIAQHSIKNRKKTFLMYFKLFILVELRWVMDFFFLLVPPTKLKFGAFILLPLHPIVLFFFLVGDDETKRYLETNYPRAKKTLDLVYGIGYPVRKCWGLIRRCKQPEDKGTNGNGAIEPHINSTYMYVHTTGASSIPK